MKEKLERIATIAKRNTRKNDSMGKRKNYLLTLLDIEIPRSKIIICQAEKPSDGSSFSVKELSDRFRINYRCGNSRYNYAPCIEVLK